LPGYLDYQTLRKLINKSKNLAYLFKIGSADLDWYLINLLCGEIMTLETILELNEKRCFKECFILLRSVLEKWLYFWLILYGIDHRWKVEYKIIPSKEENDKPIKVIRDEHCERLRKLKEKGDKNLSEAESIKPHKEKNDTKIIIYKRTGIFNRDDKERKQEPISIFYFLLTDAADRSESLYQRINDVIRDNKITREELIDIKYSTIYIPDDKKITSQALIIFDKKDSNQVQEYSAENDDSERKEGVMTELDVVEDKDELLRNK
jgi:hypothetical protein